MNSTFFACGFKKEVELNDGQLYDITATLSNSVNLDTKSVNCSFSQEVFSGRQYLETHVRFRHTPEGCLSEPYTTLSSSKAIPCEEGRDECNDDTFESPTKESCHASEDTVESPPLHHHAEKRRGRKQRRSYTVEFKKHTLDLLDQPTATKNRWNKVAEARGIYKSFIIKWNKNGQAILQEVALNKQKKCRWCKSCKTKKENDWSKNKQQ